jgi:hypothetical protein
LSIVNFSGLVARSIIPGLMMFFGFSEGGMGLIVGIAGFLWEAFVLSKFLDSNKAGSGEASIAKTWTNQATTNPIARIGPRSATFEDRASGLFVHFPSMAFVQTVIAPLVFCGDVRRLDGPRWEFRHRGGTKEKPQEWKHEDGPVASRLETAYQTHLVTAASTGSTATTDPGEFFDLIRSAIIALVGEPCVISGWDDRPGTQAASAREPPALRSPFDCKSCGAAIDSTMREWDSLVASKRCPKCNAAA